ncbi:hypothetical protein PTTG_28060 [Puccinia triticina 1-1 BBBD Race 1]|uniref:Uncharacterized protein n=2 Tax=Puccinia triticina TaxID=208348 RepID=A0A180GET4_PUCT1|nr:uncharacterized protein PtA15_1A384 [Puccinia triticina]OAV91200.1 hypothetical protein PTTG_28060 [Puccinia triticina 1-1 BBBD Race 1]WAQ81046.1 hypothetical protein PtA15_1A384 [Puccinia triticina]WAR51937.1 hypothetical protein PtB15_1B374 [Puccinia triticina]
MIATTVYNFLEPYLPAQFVYVISMVVFAFEKLFMPKFYEVYSHASLDPKTLVPFVISAIALYLSIVSIYHAFKTAFRMIWFLIKWSVVIVILWFILGFLNEAKGHSNGGNGVRNPFQSYQDSVISWWNGAAWNLVNMDPQSFLGPLQMMLGPSALSLFEPMLNHFQSHNPGTNPFRTGSKHSTSSYSSFKPSKQHSNPQNSRTRQSNENTEKPNVRDFFQKFWTQTP